MKERIRNVVEEILKDYEETPQLNDFKEEISSNLSARIAYLIKKGISQDEAAHTAFKEFGDIAQAADNIAKSNRNNFIIEAYLKKIPLDKFHAAGYVIAGLIFVFGLITAAIVFITTRDLTAVIGSLMPFVIAAKVISVYLYLTQDKALLFPMNKKRAACYAAASGFLVFGIFVLLLLFFMRVSLANIEAEGFRALLNGINVELLGSLFILLPSCAALAFLGLTEKSHLKPWAAKEMEKQIQAYDEKFGLLSGAIWMTAIGFFVLFGFLIGWSVSWIVFIFAISAQLLLQYFTIKKVD